MMPIRRFILMCVLLLATLSPLALGATPATLIAPDLEPRSVHLQSLVNDQLVYFDGDRNLQNQSVRRFVRLLLHTPEHSLTAQPNGATEQAKSQAVLFLIDGQRIPGKLVTARATQQGDILRWHCTVLDAEVDVPLESVRSITPPDAAARNRTGDTGDVLVLGNGDELSGFIEGVNAQGWVLRQDGAAQALTLPLDRALQVHLANPMKPAADEDYTLWMRDGSRLRCRNLELTEEKVAATLRMGDAQADQMQKLQVPLSSLHRIDLPTRGAVLQDVLDLPWQHTSGGEVFTVTMPPRQQGGSLWLHGPVQIDIPLPAGAARFAANVALDSGAAGEIGNEQWADLYVVVRSMSEELERVHLSPKQTTARINVPVSGLHLFIDVEVGRNGPVMDRVLVHDPVLLIKSR